MKLSELTDIGMQENAKAAMGMRINATQLESEAEDLRNRANELFQSVLDATPDGRVEQEGVGTASITVTVRSKIDQTEFGMYLVNKGVDAMLIKDAQTYATTTTESSSIRFKQVKPDGGGE